MADVRKSTRLGIGLAVMVGLVMPAAGWAQAKARKAATGGGLEIEEITVTAQKREENIQEIPISVSAVTGATLEERGAKAVSDIGESVPNLFTRQANQGSSSLQIGIRGTLVGDPSFTQNSTVGLHVDGFYIAKIEGANMDIEDLDRVEVLRGPQGTLYGKNTVGGAVNLITKKPTQERSITAATEVGNYDAFKGRLTFNVPLIGKNGYFESDGLGTLSLRENISYRSHEPYIENKSPTEVKATGGAGMANTNRVFNMTALRWQSPSKAFTVDYAFEYHRYRQAPNALQITYLRPGSVGTGNMGALGLPPMFNMPSWDMTPYVRPKRVLAEGSNVMWDTNGTTVTQKNDRFSDDGNNRMHFLTGAYDAGELGALGNVTIKALGSYRRLDASNNSDIDGSPLHMFDARSRYGLQTWSGELQWIGSAPRVHYVAGLYYYGEHTTNIDDQILLFGLLPSYRNNRGKTESYAPYGQITWTPPILNDKLSMTVGLRYTQEHVQMHATYRSAFNGPALASYLPVIPSSTWDVSVAKSYGIHGNGAPGLSPMADISYQFTDNLMGYFRVSRGFQSGAANGRAGDPISFSKMTNPEKLLGYEGGFKSQWFDNRIRLNANGFFSDYSDRVLSIARFGAGGSTNSLENAGKEEIWGAEVEMVAIPLRGLEATASYGYLSPEWTEWNAPAFDSNNQPIWVDPCAPGGTAGVNCNTKQRIDNVASQRDVPVAPQNTFTIGLTYTAPPTTAGVFSAHLDTYWSDSYLMHPEKPHYDKVSSYGLVNGRLQFVDIPLQKGSLDLAVFGRNLTDEKYRAWGFDLGGFLGWVVNSYGEPRTFGVGLTYHFAES